MDDLFADSWLSGESIYVGDLDRCRPSEALSDDAQPGRWRTMVYDTESFSGTMLLAGVETGAPEVTYPLAVSGWHAISVGLYPYHGQEIEVRARLSGEGTFSMLKLGRPDLSGRAQTIHEMFWRFADLTGQEIVLGQIAHQVASGGDMGSVKGSPAYIAYIKLVPLSEAEIDTLQDERQRTDTKRLFVHNDAHGIHYGFHPTTAEEIRRHIEPFRDSDFGRLCWEAGGGDLLQYLSNVGRRSTFDGLEDFGPQGYRMLAESWRAFRDQGIDPFQVALDYTHEIGMEFHVGYRVTGFYYPPPFDYFNFGISFYETHPELRSVDRDGNVAPRISYAYPEVRDYVLSVMREIAQYDIDGISLLYNRRPPFVEYEAPIVQGFKSEYGEDPRQIDETDPRWLLYRARTMTRFMSQLRETLDDEAKKQGRRKIEISAVVLRNEEENLYNALDLKAWIEQGLVDTIVPYTSRPDLDSMQKSWTDAGEIEWFVSLTKGTPCRLALNLMPRQQSAEDFRRMANLIYDAGVEELFFWDGDVGRSNFRASYSALRRLGHREEIASWAMAGEKPLSAPRVTLRRLGDWDLSYDTPG